MKNSPAIIATAFGGLLAGAVTGATLSSVKAIKQVKQGKITPKQATKEVIQESGSLGVATSIGVTATALLGITGILSIASVALVTASTKYALDHVLSEEIKTTKTSQEPSTNTQEPIIPEVVPNQEA